MYRFLFSLLAAVQIQIGPEVLTVEVANTPDSRAKGLMGRKELAEGHGMLFVYKRAERLFFWMKNTLIPLSIAFFDEDKTAFDIQDMDPPKGEELKHYVSSGAAQYALEVPQGWFDRHGIEAGAKFSFLDQSNRIE